MQSPPFPRYLIPPRSKYSPQNHILKHPQLPFLPCCQRRNFTPIHLNSVYPSYSLKMETEKNIQNRKNPEPQCLVIHDFITWTAARRSRTVTQINSTNNASISLERRSPFLQLPHRQWVHSGRYILYALIKNTNFQGRVQLKCDGTRKGK